MSPLPVVLIILIILLAGLLGGITNYYLIWNPEIPIGETRMLKIKCILMGLCASITVPLFLQVLPNDLLTITDTMPVKNYLIIAGLCVLASYFSKRFLEDLYDKINNIEKKTETIDKKVEEAKKAVEDVEMQNVEIDDIDEVVQDVIAKTSTNIDAISIQKVANAVLNTTYSYRTVPGISEDTINDQDKVNEILLLLQKSGYVEAGKNKRGKDIWKGIYHKLK
ncbi:MAG: YEATS-associated helix-containing protein [Bacteroidales bacterium]